MRYNLECARAVLLFLESSEYVELNDNGFAVFKLTPIEALYAALPDYPHEDIFYSTFNLAESGYIEESHLDTGDGICCFSVIRITAAGHAFLEGVRDPKRWSLTKRLLGSVRDFSLDAIEHIAKGMTSALADQALQQSTPQLLDLFLK